MIDHETFLSQGEMIARLLLAALLGGLIGIERERTSWFAGLRTHMLVCTGSTLIMIVSQYGFAGVLHKDFVVLDPSRIAAQVVSGIGFLGAGTILFWKNTIRGLTTAASLWAVAAIGLSIGGGLYLAATVATMLCLFVLAGVKPIERAFFKRRLEKEIKFTANDSLSLIQIDELLTQLNARSSLTNFQVEFENHKQVVHLFFKLTPDINLLHIVDEIKSIDGIANIEVID